MEFGIGKKTTARLLECAEDWDIDEFKYICLDEDGVVYLSNELSGPGHRKWNRAAFDGFIKNQDAI